MASLQLARVVVDWSGTMVRGQSNSVLMFEAGTGTVDTTALRACFATAALALPSGLTVTIPSSGDLVDEFTGTLIGAWTGSAVSTVAGSGGTKCAAGVGACATWQTGMVVAGKRLRGRTFLVPLASDAYDVDGTLTTAVKGYLDSFAGSLAAMPAFAVWHRPTFTGTGPGKTNNGDGASRLVATGTIRDKVAVLTSRRD